MFLLAESMKRICSQSSGYRQSIWYDEQWYWNRLWCFMFHGKNFQNPKLHNTEKTMKLADEDTLIARFWLSCKLYIVTLRGNNDNSITYSVKKDNQALWDGEIATWIFTLLWVFVDHSYCELRKMTPTCTSQSPLYKIIQAQHNVWCVKSLGKWVSETLTVCIHLEKAICAPHNSTSGSLMQYILSAKGNLLIFQSRQSWICKNNPLKWLDPNGQQNMIRSRVKIEVPSVVSSKVWYNFDDGHMEEEKSSNLARACHNQLHTGTMTGGC